MRREGPRGPADRDGHHDRELYARMVTGGGFAVITVALISGSIADRATMRGRLVYVVLWLVVVCIPIAHWGCSTRTAGS